MRVLDTTTGQFVYVNPRETKYAILSHTWDPILGEQTYQELKEIQKLCDAPERKLSPVVVRRDSESQNPHPSIECADEHRASHMPWRRRAQNHNPESRVRRWLRIPHRPVVTILQSTPRHDQDESSSASGLAQPITSSPSVPLQPTPLHEPPSTQTTSPIWEDPRLSPKIREACRVAREKGYQYMWIDSCCIDKTSSSELSESINSMYQWYALSDVCYTILSDVPAGENHKAWNSQFRKSRWFTRGWTLQELVAPMDVVFFAADWTTIGTKHNLADLIIDITNVNYNALLRIEPLDEFSVAQRFSWAAERETTRVEDRAYSLLGIFNINMPTLYGEGEGAFRRLQEEIMQRTPDQSIFAWTDHGQPDEKSQLYDPDAIHSDTGSRRFHFERMPKLGHPSLLAPSLDGFIGCAAIEALPHDEVFRRLQSPPGNLSATDYDFTPYGIRLQLPVVSFLTSNYFSVLGLGSVDEEHTNIPFSQWYLVILGCEHRNFPGQLLGRVCYIQSPGSSIEHLYSGYIEESTTLLSFTFTSDLIPLSSATITRLQSPPQISSKTLYIPQPARDEGVDNPAYRRPHETVKLVLLKKTCALLAVQGYSVTLRNPDDIHPATHSVTLSHDTHTVVIDYHHVLKGDSYDYQRLKVTADVKILGSQVPADGLGTQVSCTSSPPWDPQLRFEPDAELRIPGDMVLVVNHGLTFATINHYILDIELKSRRPAVMELDGNRCRAIMNISEVETSMPDSGVPSGISRRRTRTTDVSERQAAAE